MASDRVTVDEGLVFGAGGGRDLLCDVYRPPAGVANGAAVLLVHGGGWSSGDRSQLKGFGILLGREGYLCVASEYRLTGEAPWPAQIEDVKAAIRWMRANADELGIDADRIAIEGNSAGAQLATFAAGTAGDPRWEGSGGNEGVSTAVAAAIGFYTPTLFGAGFDEPRGAIAGAVLMLGDQADAASPLTYASADFPPTLLVHGNDDSLVPESASLLMYEALRSAGAPVELHIYADQPHAFDADPAFGRQSAAIMRLFLDRYVAGVRPVRAQVPAEVTGEAVAT